MQKNHCEVPAVRDPDPWILHDLREIDPTLDCHYVGEGRWVIGSVKNDRRRKENGHVLVNSRRDDPLNLRIGLLQLQGFTTIAMFEDVHGELTDEYVRDIRCVDWRYRHERRLALEEALDIAEGLPEKRRKKQAIADRGEAWARDEWATMFRGKRTFSVPKGLAATTN